MNVGNSLQHSSLAFSFDEEGTRKRKDDHRPTSLLLTSRVTSILAHKTKFPLFKAVDVGIP